MSCGRSRLPGRAAWAVLHLPPAGVLVLALAVTAGPAAGALPGRAGRADAVVVAGHAGMRSEQVGALVARAGGRVTRRLPIVDGVAALVPRRSIARLRAETAIRSVTPDAAGRVLALDPVLGYDPDADFGSLNQVTRVINAQESWRAGFTGRGVDVALIDSGVSPVPGLTSGNVINGPDLSFDSQNPALSDLDGFGHGTHMASIIGGRDVVQSRPAAYVGDASHFTGVAPDARLVSLKVAAADGSADVSQVIAAIGWVDQHAHDYGLNIRVMSLSYGTNSTQAVDIDPLDYAVEQAWRHGIVVVVAAGNDGSTTRTLADPANDPYVIAVGAEDPNGTVSPSDDLVPTFSQRGSVLRPVDVVAPGVHVLGLRDPNGAIDQANPTARVGDRFFRGSGTSQATAVVSGAAALLLSGNPLLTNDQVKMTMRNSAFGFRGNQAFRGRGLINVRAAQTAVAPSGSGNSGLLPGTGVGLLSPARGSAEGSTGPSGERDIFGHPWLPASWAASVADRTSWGPSGTFNGNTWTGSAFDGHSWTGVAWATAPWTAPPWSGGDWLSHSWTSHSWTGGSWDSHSWTGGSWTSSAWTASTWSSASWN